MSILSTCQHVLIVYLFLNPCAAPLLHSGFTLFSLHSVRLRWLAWRKILWPFRPSLPLCRTNVYSGTSATILVKLIVIGTQSCMVQTFAPCQIANCILHMFRGFSNALGGCSERRHHGVSLFFQSPTHIMQPGQMCLNLLEREQLLPQHTRGKCLVVFTIGIRNSPVCPSSGGGASL